MFAWSRYWATLLPLSKTFSACHFQFCRLLKQHVLYYTEFELTYETLTKLWESLTMGMFRGSSFRPRKSTNPQNKRFGVWKTYMELCGKVEVQFKVSMPAFLPEL